MKVRCVFTAYFTDENRRSVNAYYGKPGMATRDELKFELESRGNLQNPDWVDMLFHDEEERKAREDEAGEGR